MVKKQRWLGILIIIFLLLMLGLSSAAAEDIYYPILQKGDRGEVVKLLQRKLQERSFLTAKVDGVFGQQTKLSVILLQQFNALNCDGVVGPQTWNVLNEQESTYRLYTIRCGDTLWDLSREFSISVTELKKLNNIKNGDYIRNGDQIKLPGKVKTKNVQTIHWAQVDNFFAIREEIILTDVETGLNFQVRRVGGSNHADVEPLTACDTAVLRQIYEGKWSWVRRAVIAHIDGHQIAASINGMPHEYQFNTKNKFPGHICLHFQGSRLHKNDKEDDEHQKMVEKAGEMNWPLGIYH